MPALVTEEPRRLDLAGTRAGCDALPAGAADLSFLPLPLPSAALLLPERRRLDERGERVEPSVSVVVPMLNEERTIGELLEALDAQGDEIVVVDGHSTDRSVEVVHAVVPAAMVVEQPGRGKGDALRAGFALCNGDAVVMLDADGSMQPDEVPRFVGALRAGAEVVKGSRFLPSAGSDDIDLLRRIGNRGLVDLFNRCYGTRFTDLCYGYLAFWRRCLPELEFNAERFDVEAELNIRSVLAGLRVEEVPSFELRRGYGESNLHPLRDGWRIARVVLGESGGLRLWMRRRPPKAA